MLELDKDGTMIDPDRSMEEINRVMLEFEFFVNYLKEMNRKDWKGTEEEKQIAEINCNGALILAESYLEMKRSFSICKDDPMMMGHKDIKA